MQAHYGSQQAPAQESALHALGRNALMDVRGAARGLAGIGGLVIDPFTRLANYAAAKTNGYGTGKNVQLPTVAESADAALNAVGIPNPQPQNGQEALAQRISEGIGSGAGGAGVGRLLAKAPGLAGQIGNMLAARPGLQIASGATGSGASEAVRQMGGGTAAQVGAGLLGGMAPAAAEIAGAGAAKGIARLTGQATPSDVQLARIAQQHGIPLKASQVVDSKNAKLVDSTTGQVPFSGAHAFEQQQQAHFDRAVTRTIGENADAFTPDVFARAKNRISQTYEDLASRIDPEITPQVADKLDGVLRDALEMGDKGTIRAVKSSIRRVQSQLTDQGTIPGHAYKSLDSTLGQMARNGGEKGFYAGQLRDIMRDAFTASAKNPEDIAAMAKANQQYRDLKTLEPLVAEAAQNGGHISPAKLQAAVLASKAGKAAMATGTRGDLGDLAMVGQRFLKERVQDSGTARRTLAFNTLKYPGAVVASALGTGAAFNPATGAATAAGSILSARAIQKLLRDPRVLEAVMSGKRIPAPLPGTAAASIPTAANINGLLYDQGQ